MNTESEEGIDCCWHGWGGGGALSSAGARVRLRGRKRTKTNHVGWRNVQKTENAFNFEEGSSTGGKQPGAKVCVQGRPTLIIERDGEKNAVVCFGALDNSSSIILLRFPSMGVLGRAHTGCRTHAVVCIPDNFFSYQEVC